MNDSNVVFTATSTINTYIVKFISNGSVFFEKTYTYGSLLSLPDNDPGDRIDGKYLYEFVEWIAFEDGAVVKTDLTFEASFTKSSALVTNDDGTLSASSDSESAILSKDTITKAKENALSDSSTTLTISVNGGNVKLDAKAINALGESSASLTITRYLTSEGLHPTLSPDRI